MDHVANMVQKYPPVHLRAISHLHNIQGCTDPVTRSKLISWEGGVYIAGCHTIQSVSTQ